jgi:hypothetical protein
MKTLKLLLLSFLLSAACTQAQTGEAYVQKQQAAAKAGDYWAKYNLWDTYHRGKHGVAKDAAEADKWLQEVIKGVSLVKFEGANGFNPTNNQEFLRKFGERSRMTSGKTSVGAASFFRTTKQGNKLVASFLSAFPDALKADIEKNPSLKFISAEKLTAEMFIAYEQSKPESL